MSKTKKIRPIDIAVALAGGTQADLANKIGCTQGAVSKWVRGGAITPSKALDIEVAFPGESAVTIDKFCPRFAKRVSARAAKARAAKARRAALPNFEKTGED